MLKSVSFHLFSDLHYRKMMYAIPLKDMEIILNRANINNSDFILNSGDFCNDYVGSPELINLYIKNKYNLKVYGIYGNHELEANNNSMKIVTPLLTNQCNNVIWGTHDGKISKYGSIGYYYFDIKNAYRFICLDSNYSYNINDNKWEHNKTCSYGAPENNKFENSLGIVQTEWLKTTINDAIQNNLKCIINSHVAYAGKEENSLAPDYKSIIDIINSANKIKPNTVILVINGHYHTSSTITENGILFLDVPAVRNTYWELRDQSYYSDSQTFNFENFDPNGNYINSKPVKLNQLWQGTNACYNEIPVSFQLKISEDGIIKFTGMQSKWLYNVIPDGYGEYAVNAKSFCYNYLSKSFTELSKNNF